MILRRFLSPGGRSGVVRESFGGRSGVAWGSFGVRAGVVWGRSGIVPGSFGGRSIVVRGRSGIVRQNLYKKLRKIRRSNYLKVKVFGDDVTGYPYVQS